MKTALPGDPWLELFPALAHIDHPAWMAALESATIMTLPARKVIFKQGDSGRSFVLILNGSVRVYHTSEAGREIVLYRIRPGEMCILSLVRLLNMSEYAAEAKTESEVCVASIPFQKFHAAMEASAALQTSVMMTMGRRLLQITALLEDVSFERVDTRIARWVMDHLDPVARRVNVTHSHLASELGATREGIGRTLKRFERQGWVLQTRGTIHVLDADSLSRVADRV